MNRALLPALLLLGFSRVLGSDYAQEIRPLLEKFCFDCHGAKKQKAQIQLNEFQDLAGIYGAAPLWDKVLGEVREEAMPPEDKPQPTPEERQKLVTWLDRTLNDPDLEASLPRDPGRPFLHRLSRLEYNLTIRDLLGIDSHPADDFPPDGGGGGGFDNNSATLFIPPVLMEKYLSTATRLLNEAPAERLVAVRPSPGLAPEAAARQNLERFLTRAYRRPVTAAEITPLLGLFSSTLQAGRSFDDALRFALRPALVSPHFLFRVEVPRGPEAHRLSDFELASRLSYFLWSSMPDEELFRVAAAGQLQQPAVLVAQTRRMLQDPKARALAENFAGQWWRIDELTTFAHPDARTFPEFGESLRKAFYAEPIEFFHGLLKENGSLLRVLDAEYTYLNEELARFYGIDGVQGEAFQRVALSDRNRGGVLTMGAVLTLTSYPRRTSPVLRGKWVLETILGTPPPPAPPLIKSLPESDRVRDGLSLRQQLERHRRDPDCAGCHSRMDPLGFGLENFDAIGRWRLTVAGQPVDASGTTPGGEKFTGAVEFKALLLKRKDEFARNVSARLFAYALNRGLEGPDVPMVRHAAKALAADDYRVESLILQIVQSYPFQNRRGAAQP